MRRSMVDIQSATAEIKRRKKEEETGQNIMSAPAMQGGHKYNKCHDNVVFVPK